MAELLRRRYGKALQDLIPTEASRLYLWGDDLHAPQKVEATRREIFWGDSLSWFGRGDGLKQISSQRTDSHITAAT